MCAFELVFYSPKKIQYFRRKIFLFKQVNIEFENDFDLAEVNSLLKAMPGIVLIDNPSANEYPMPINAEGKDEVFVGRVRKDLSREKCLNMWIVADNLRKGAATNAIQIAEYLYKQEWVK